MKLINLKKAIDYAKEKDYIKTSGQEEAVREVFALATVDAVPIDVLDKIRTEVIAIAVNGQVDEHTMFIRTGEQVKQMILEIIDKYKASPANCSTCILDNTDACTRGAGRAVDDEACDDYLASPTGTEGGENE